MAWDGSLPDSAAYWWPRYARCDKKERTPEQEEKRRQAKKAQKHAAYLNREAKRQAKEQI